MSEFIEHVKQYMQKEREMLKNLQVLQEEIEMEIEPICKNCKFYRKSGIMGVGLCEKILSSDSINKVKEGGAYTSTNDPYANTELWTTGSFGCNLFEKKDGRVI